MSALEFGSDIQIGVILILIAVSTAITLLHGASRRPSSRTWRYRKYPRAVANGIPSSPLPDVGEQLHAVMEGTFKRRRVMNRAEYRVFKIIEDDVSAAGTGHRVFAQTSLGEVLQSADSNAFHSINAKRVDILIVDCAGWPVVAVEYQGGRHYQGTAAARDAIKKEALRKAGVRYVEIVPDDSDDQIRFRVREQLGWKASVSLEPAPFQQAVVAQE